MKHNDWNILILLFRLKSVLEMPYIWFTSHNVTHFSGLGELSRNPTDIRWKASQRKNHIQSTVQTGWRCNSLHACTYLDYSSGPCIYILSFPANYDCWWRTSGSLSHRRSSFDEQRLSIGWGASVTSKNPTLGSCTSITKEKSEHVLANSPNFLSKFFSQKIVIRRCSLRIWKFALKIITIFLIVL